MSQLIALTIEAEDQTLEAAINGWFANYCEFKLAQLDQHETLLHTSISTATGGLPAMLGMDILRRAGQTLFKSRNT